MSCEWIRYDFASVSLTVRASFLEAKAAAAAATAVLSNDLLLSRSLPLDSCLSVSVSLAPWTKGLIFSCGTAPAFQGHLKARRAFLSDVVVVVVVLWRQWWRPHDHERFCFVFQLHSPRAPHDATYLLLIAVDFFFFFFSFLDSFRAMTSRIFAVRNFIFFSQTFMMESFEFECWIVLENHLRMFMATNCTQNLSVIR